MIDKQANFYFSSAEIFALFEVVCLCLVAYLLGLWSWATKVSVKLGQGEGKRDCAPIMRVCVLLLCSSFGCVIIL